MITLRPESYTRIAQFLTEQGEGTEAPGEFDSFDVAQALRNATLPELEAIIRQMSRAQATLDFASLGEGYAEMFESAIETLKQMYEGLYADESATSPQVPQQPAAEPQQVEDPYQVAV